MQYQSTVTLTTHRNASFVQKVGSDGVHQGGGISYTRVRELLLEKTEQLGGMDPSVFGVHSLWAGGTTAAVRNKYSR